MTTSARAEVERRVLNHLHQLCEQHGLAPTPAAFLLLVKAEKVRRLMAERKKSQRPCDA
jgi:hypothetical protein